MTSDNSTCSSAYELVSFTSVIRSYSLAMPDIGWDVDGSPDTFIISIDNGSMVIRYTVENITEKMSVTRIRLTDGTL